MLPGLFPDGLEYAVGSFDAFRDLAGGYGFDMRARSIIQGDSIHVPGTQNQGTCRLQTIFHGNFRFSQSGRHPIHLRNRSIQGGLAERKSGPKLNREAASCPSPSSKPKT